jgi:hypothetical protein
MVLMDVKAKALASQLAIVAKDKTVARVRDLRWNHQLMLAQALVAQRRLPKFKQ